MATDKTPKNDNPIGTAVQAYKDIIPSPLMQHLLVAGLAYGGARLAWEPMVETMRSIGRGIGPKITGLSPAEWDAAMTNLSRHSKYKQVVPAAIGLLAAGISTGLTWNPYQEYYGQFSWDAPVKSHKLPSSHSFGKFMIPEKMQKESSLIKQAEDLFSYGGPIPEIDFSQSINAREAKNLFTNDPFLQDHGYARNMGTAIVSNAAMISGSNNPTLGNVFDSAFNKIQNKLSFEGVASVGAKTMVSNGLARMFTGALDAVVGLSPGAQRAIVDTGTWAGAITAILE